MATYRIYSVETQSTLIRGLNAEAVDAWIEGHPGLEVKIAVEHRINDTTPDDPQ